jgi:nickel-type superoxide dismutase maturation protease
MIRRVVVHGASMQPTLREGQRLLVGPFVRGPRRGDVAVLRHPRGFEVVKRVAGVPGDTVGDRVLGPGEFWVRGDNPAASTDSATEGPVGRGAFTGRVLGSYRPLGRVR